MSSQKPHKTILQTAESPEVTSTYFPAIHNLQNSFHFFMIILWSLLMLKMLFLFFPGRNCIFNQASQKELLLILMWKEIYEKKYSQEILLQNDRVYLTAQKMKRLGSLNPLFSTDHRRVFGKLNSEIRLCLETAWHLLHITGTSGEMQLEHKQLQCPHLLIWIVS